MKSTFKTLPLPNNCNESKNDEHAQRESYLALRLCPEAACADALSGVVSLWIVHKSLGALRDVRGVLLVPSTVYKLALK